MGKRLTPAQWKRRVARALVLYEQAKERKARREQERLPFGIGALEPGRRAVKKGELEAFKIISPFADLSRADSGSSPSIRVVS